MRLDTPLDFYDWACEQRAEGDLFGALATLDDGLAAVGLEDGADDWFAFLLHTKADTLGLLGHNDEALALFYRVLEIIDGGEDDEALRLLQAESRMGIALILAARNEHLAAEEALRDLASSYGSDQDSDVRSVAASALAYRVGELLKLDDFDGARAGWDSLRVLYRDDPEVRGGVALGGMMAALGLLRARRTTASLAIADGVIALCRTETDLATRMSVAVTMLARSVALRRRVRLFACARASRDLVNFLGHHPEPELIEAMRSAGPYGEALVRRALGRRG